MERRSGTALRVAVLSVALTIPSAFESTAHAQEGEPIRLEYRASAGCPERAAFVARVHAKTARARFVEPGERARIFAVDVSAGPPSAGSISVSAAEGAGGARSVQAGSCEEVADALALMVALAVDPQAAASPGTGATPGASAPPQELSGNGAPPSPPPARPAAPTTTAPPVQTAESPRLAYTPSTEGLPPSPSPDRQRLFVGADLAAATGVSPTTLLGAAPFVGYDGARRGWLSPSIRGTFLHAATGTLNVLGGEAQFTWNVGRLDGCLLAWPTHALRLGACARAEAGVLGVNGSATVAPQTTHSAWLAAGAVGHLEWGLLGSLFLDAQAGPILRITNDRFYFLPNTTAYHVPLVAIDAEAGVGVHFL